MASASTGSDFSLQIKRIFNAPREKVFEAWTDPEKLGHWFCNSRPEYSGRVTELELRPGGRYRLEVHDKSGKLQVLRGEYKEIDAPEKLSFTWFWETQPEYGETLIVLAFNDIDGKTELVLTQGSFPTVTGRDAHNRGWVVCFDSLERLLEA
jgi:uncharacterized protein YndB with AHSA1/START domain